MFHERETGKKEWSLSLSEFCKAIIDFEESLLRHLMHSSVTEYKANSSNYQNTLKIRVIVKILEAKSTMYKIENLSLKVLEFRNFLEINFRI